MISKHCIIKMSHFRAASGFGAVAGTVTSSGFKFGAGYSTTETPSSGFKFGVTAASTAPTETAGTGFKFGGSDKKDSSGCTPSSFQGPITESF